jgi:hypothetical protein
MFIVFGTKVMFKTVGTGMFHCPACAADRGYRLRQARRWFSLFWIPVIPMKAIGTIVECEGCGRKFNENVLSAPTVSETAEGIGFAQRALAAHMVDVSDNTTVSRETAIAVMRENGLALYDASQLDIDRETSDWERVRSWAEHLRGTLSAAGAETMLMGAARVAAADGIFTDAERQVLSDLGGAFGLTPVHIDGILAKAAAMSPHANG